MGARMTSFLFQCISLASSYVVTHHLGGSAATISPSNITTTEALAYLALPINTTMASSAQASPRQRISSADLDAFDDFNHINNNNNNNGGNRSRLSSSEIPRTYSGLYGAGVSGHGS
eukprot:scaffold6437_cov98-Skeletonema_dohrnii-CCMP3373.AAC.1